MPANRCSASSPLSLLRCGRSSTTFQRHTGFRHGEININTWSCGFQARLCCARWQPRISAGEETQARCLPRLYCSSSSRLAVSRFLALYGIPCHFVLITIGLDCSRLRLPTCPCCHYRSWSRVQTYGCHVVLARVCRVPRLFSRASTVVD